MKYIIIRPKRKIDTKKIREHFEKEGTIGVRDNHNFKRPKSKEFIKYDKSKNDLEFIVNGLLELKNKVDVRFKIERFGY